ncbi:hypothetical protein O181_071130 [Austropuccinia psidii MF-1]|uniref:Mitochondrial carrier protein n=1 Tax=Austropuccinia psidii MF-1 TaxID=1389203 RepID=A0A9Q3I9R3_9BASI|nr:hypothetical protein [Austropuccinia psidii MF-1]
MSSSSSSNQIDNSKNLKSITIDQNQNLDSIPSGPPVGPLPILPGSIDQNSNSIAALARSLVSSLAWLFKRPPIRFFRPVKISTWATLNLIHQVHNKNLSWGLIQSIFKNHSNFKLFLNHILPPFIFNTFIGLTLFSTFTTIENHLSSCKLYLHPYFISSISGACAGLTQALISAPLDNINLLRLNQSIQHLYPNNKLNHKSIKSLTWIQLIKQSFNVDLSNNSNLITSLSKLQRFQIALNRVWSLLSLTIIKDSIGFASFFTIFQIGRDLENINQFLQPTWTAKILQASVIVLSGATAGWLYGIISKPFDLFRQIVWQVRLEWTKINQNSNCKFKNTTQKKSFNQSDHEIISLNQNRLRNRLDHQNISFNQARLENRIKQKHHQLTKHLINYRKSLKDPIQSTQFPSIYKILKWYLIHQTQFKKTFKTIQIQNGIINSTNTDTSSSPFETNQIKFKNHPSKTFYLMAAKPTRFRNFLFSPYSIGFFVWAVCSGDLSWN